MKDSKISSFFGTIAKPHMPSEKAAPPGSTHGIGGKYYVQESDLEEDGDDDEDTGSKSDDDAWEDEFGPEVEVDAVSTVELAHGQTKVDPRDTTSIACPIFKNLLNTIYRDNKYTDVVDYLDKKSAAETWTVVDRLVKSNPELHDVVRKHNWSDTDALRQVKGKVRGKKGRSYGWYANVVTRKDRNGRRTYVKMYIGQARNISRRISKHKGRIRIALYRALHYRIARLPGNESHFVVLAEIMEPYGTAPQPMKDPLLDLVEAYFCLLFQTLPRKTLAQYLPQAIKIREVEIGLNVASPLNQNRYADEAKREISRLKDSTDPDVRAYLSNMTKEARAAALIALEEYRFVPVSQGLRRISKKAHLFRGPNDDDEDEVTIKLVCSGCGISKIIDPDPIFRKADGVYIAREQRCVDCPVPAGRKYATKLFHPVDKRAKISMQKLK